jgi:hypothetical protein
MPNGASGANECPDLAERRRSSTAAGGHTCRSFTDRCAPAGGDNALETERSITALIVG